MTDPLHSPIFASALEVDPRVLCRDRGTFAVSITEKDFNSRVEGVEIKGTLSVNLKVISSRADQFWIEISYSGERVLMCSRKLKPFASAIQDKFEILLKYSEAVQDCKIEENVEDYPVILVHPQTKEFSILELIRQELILNEPLSPVENPEEEFGWHDPELQEEDKVDPRWAKLLELKKKKDQE